MFRYLKTFRVFWANVTSLLNKCFIIYSTIHYQGEQFNGNVFIVGLSNSHF